MLTKWILSLRYDLYQARARSQRPKRFANLPISIVIRSEVYTWETSKVRYNRWDARQNPKSSKVFHTASSSRAWPRIHRYIICQKYFSATERRKQKILKVFCKRTNKHEEVWGLLPERRSKFKRLNIVTFQRFYSWTLNFSGPFQKKVRIFCFPKKRWIG